MILLGQIFGYILLIVWVFILIVAFYRVVTFNLNTPISRIEIEIKGNKDEDKEKSKEKTVRD